MAMSCAGLMLQAGVVSHSGSGVTVMVDGGTVELSFYSPSTVRVVKYPGSDRPDKESYAIIAEPTDVACKVKESPRNTTVTTSGLTVRIDNKNGELTFISKSGRELMKENGPARFTSITDLGDSTYEVGQTFTLRRDEAVYGLGNLANGRLSQRGITRQLMPGNIEDGIPAIVSSRGYGLYWDNYSPTEYSDKDSGMSLTSQVGDCVDYYFMNGGDADGVIAEMRAISGEVPMFPLWSYGFWQSRERYKSQHEITGVVNKYRELGLPLDGIIQDWQYWGGNYLWNAMEFMNPGFNNPQKMMDDIHAANAHAIISIWSSFGPQTKPYRELADRGLLFDISTWPQSGIDTQWPPRMDYPSGVKVYNTYSDEARDIYWNNLKRLHAFGMDGWWMDSTEPDHFDGNMDFSTGKGSFRRVRGAYPLLTVGGVHDHQIKEDSTKRVFILTRSGWFGQQRYGCNVWTGDVSSTWDMLRKQIPAHLNFSMTGNPNCNSDLGGFFCGHYKVDGKEAYENPQFRELVVRWTQLGVFTPMMRSHGADSPREIYLFGKKGEPVYDALESAVRLRYELLPYIYSTSWDVTANSSTFMRPLVMDFPKDVRGYDCASEYMFGRSLLVAPVLEARYTPEATVKIDENTGWDHKETVASELSGNIDFMAEHDQKVYLPAGTVWYDYHSGRRYGGGRTVNIATTIHSIPVFARAGSIIPNGPKVNYATERPWDNLVIKVFPGADGRFTLYEDEGDNYNYTKGKYTTIDFVYDRKSGTVTVNDRKGEYPGMLASRKFTIVNGATGNRNEIDYNGKAVKVALPK